MQVHFGLGRLAAEWPRSVVCVGTFDGVHLGHQAVIARAVARARGNGEPAVLVTFDRHPASVLAPAKRPRYLCGLEESLERFRALGVDVAVVLPFDAALSRLSAEEFLALLTGPLRAGEVVVGHDFAMGNGREGTAHWLAARLPTETVPPFELDGERVSSSRIREAVARGEMERASRWLGRPFRIVGTVVGGQRLGRTLGYPTANVARSFDGVLPRDGVYAVQAETPFGAYAGALAIGLRPAVNGEGRTIEAYLLDYSGDSLYGRTVHFDLHRFLRPEADFPSLDALVRQMDQDVVQVREVFARPAVPLPTARNLSISEA